MRKSEKSMRIDIQLFVLASLFRCSFCTISSNHCKKLIIELNSHEKTVSLFMLLADWNCWQIKIEFERIESGLVFNFRIKIWYYNCNQVNHLKPLAVILLCFHPNIKVVDPDSAQTQPQKSADLFSSNYFYYRDLERFYFLLTIYLARDCQKTLLNHSLVGRETLARSQEYKLHNFQ